MRDFPRLRWLAFLLAVAFGVVAAGLNFDLAAVLGSLGVKAAGIGAGLLAIARIIEEAMRPIGGAGDNPMVFTQGRGQGKRPGFWATVRRAL